MAAPCARLLEFEPDLIVISDDDEPLPSVTILPLGCKTISAETEPRAPVTSPPRTPGRLSLSFCNSKSPSEKELHKITSVVKIEKTLPATSPPHTPGRLSLSYCKSKSLSEKDLVTITPIVKIENSETKTVLPQSVTAKDCSTVSSNSFELLREAKLQSLIEKFHKTKEAMQIKTKTNLMLPIPESGPQEPYHCPENVNEVHSSTGSNEIENNEITRMFDSCRELSTDNDDIVIIDKMWAKVNKCDSLYTNSQKFRDFTKSIHAKIILETKNMHLYLKEFYDELVRIPHYNKKSKSDQSKLQKNSLSSDADTIPSTSHSSPGGHEPDTTSVETGNEKHVQKLEKLLKKCSKKIRKLEEKEMSVNDLDNDGSIYILIDRYKKKCLQIWKKLCELNGQKKVGAGRVTEKKFTYEGSRFPEVNKCVSRLVNRNKSFPDFCDVINLITECNEQYDLHLRPFQIDSLAREAFKDIGKELKHRRILDYEEHFGCPMLNPEDLYNDPASQDKELNDKLVASGIIGMKKATEVFESFAQKQTELDQQLPNLDGSETQNDEESEEEDTEKEAPVDVGEMESESESESKEEDEVEENEAVEEDDEEEEESDSAEIECEAIKEDPATLCVTPRDHFSQNPPKRYLATELSAQPPAKRNPIFAGKVQVKILNDMEDVPKPCPPDLSNQDSCDSDIFIIE